METLTSMPIILSFETDFQGKFGSTVHRTDELELRTKEWTFSHLNISNYLGKLELHIRKQTLLTVRFVCIHHRQF